MFFYTHGNEPTLICGISSLHGLGLELVVRQILPGEIDCETKSTRTCMALQHAAKNGHQGVVHLLLKLKADPNITDNDRQSPLFFAAVLGYQGIVRLLLGSGVDMKRANDDGESALFIAAKKGRQEVVSLLLGSGASVEGDDIDPDVEDTGSVCRDGSEILLKAKANIEAKDSYGRIALWYADKEQHSAISIYTIA